MPTQRAVHKIIETLSARGESVSVAESLTGGGVGAALTSVAGASQVFLGGIVAYQNQIKIAMLGVSDSLIEEFGVVSEEVAVSMAQGAQKIFQSTWAIATTGVAGPDPVDGHPAGEVWVAIRGPINQSTQLQLSGSREVVRNATVSSAVTTFARILASRE